MTKNKELLDQKSRAKYNKKENQYNRRNDISEEEMKEIKEEE